MARKVQGKRMPDYYKKIRIPVAPPSKVFRDKEEILSVEEELELYGDDEND